MEISAPLAARMRPQTIDDIVGQKHLLAPNKPLRRLIDQDRLFSMILYGPPGTGKTTFARLLAQKFAIESVALNAVSMNKADIVSTIKIAEEAGNLLFIIDEIHRLNKDKQELLLPHMESGLLIVIGMTTVNPFHSVNPAIRSRCQLFGFRQLNVDDIVPFLYKTLAEDTALAELNITLQDDAALAIASFANGDLRTALNLLETLCYASVDNQITLELVEELVGRPNVLYDKNGENFYNLLSAMQKSIRGSDVNAALYWLARFAITEDLEALERRLLVMAYEDVGLGNPQATARTVQAIDVAKRVGFPEAIIPLSVAVVDLALSPKSRTAYEAVARVKADMDAGKVYDVPDPIKLQPVNLPKAEQYNWGDKDSWLITQYLPDELAGTEYISFDEHRSGKYEKALAAQYQQYIELRKQMKEKK